MIINKIIFKNFMAYFDEVEFEFPVKDNKNVTIIYAPNDVGKTCFYKGFLFCLYGPEKGTNLADLINVNAVADGKYEAFVSIFAEHQGNDLNFTRTIKPKGIVNGHLTNQHLEQRLRIWINGKEPSDEPLEAMDFINSIVHKEAAKYFFFDGEQIETYNIASAADYKEAILRILGIKEVEFAIQDFKRLRRDYERERDDILSKESQGNTLVQQKNKIISTIEDFDKDLYDHETELKDIQSRIVKLEDKLKENEAIKEKIEERQKIKKKIEELKDRRKRVEDEKVKSFRENGTMILGSILANELKPTVEELITTPVTTLPSKDFLTQLLNEPHCICGTELNDERKKNILNAIDFLAKKDIVWQQKIERKKAIQTLDMFANHSEKAKVNYNELCRDKVKINLELNRLEEKDLELRSEVGSYNETVVQKISDEIARLEQRNREVEIKIHEIQARKELQEKELNDLERKIAKFSVGKEKEEAERKLLFVRKVTEALTEYQEILIQEKRKEVEDHSSRIFLQLTNKPNKYKSLKLSDSYQLMIEHSDGQLYQIERGRSLNPSTGQSKIISLSYIAGINRSSNAIAPVVIDNPVGLFSEEHRKRVVQYLPHFGKQVIFMVTNADLNSDYHEIIEPYVNRSYHLQDDADEIWNKTQIAKVEGI